MSRLQLNCRVPPRTHEQLEAIARTLPTSAGGMPQTKTDALILAVNRLFDQVAHKIAAEGRQGE